MMRIDPSTHMLESLRAEQPNFVILIGEAVDNSFDANAMNIGVFISDDAIRFKDDGVGVSKDRVKAIVAIGAHGGMTSTALGRYGVGIKFQALSAGDQLEVDSVSRDGRVMLTVNWDRIIKRDIWEIDDPDWTPAPASVPTGTTVSIKRLRAKAPSAVKLKKIKEDLSQRFYPALREGRTITVAGERLIAVADPQISDVIDERMQFDGGKSAHVRAGVLVDPRSSLRQVHISYRHRVIMPRTSFGCGEITGPMFARVELFGPWGLSKFKDDIVDEHRDDLEAALMDALAPVLEKCRTKSMSAVIDDMTQRVNALVPPQWTPMRPEKTGKQKDVAEKKARKPGSDEKGSESPTGPAKSKRAPKNSLQIVFEDSACEEFGYGRFDKTGRPWKVFLAKDNPRIAHLLNHRDREESAKSLIDIAMSIFVHDRPLTEAQGEMQYKSFGVQLWEIIARQPVASEEEAA